MRTRTQPAPRAAASLARAALLLAATSLTVGALAAPSPAAADESWRSAAPAPLAARPFQMPQASVGKLSNGLTVWVVENHEVPLAYVNVVFRTGAWLDPDDKPGLASATFGMLTEGAAGMDDVALAKRLKALGAEAWGSAGLDSASVGVSGLSRSLPGALDVLTDLVLRPDFPEDAWAVDQKRRVQGLTAARQDPGAISSRVQSAVLYGPRYAGRLSSEAAVQATTTADLRAFWAENARPEEAVVLVGGDTTLAEVLPLLEARLGGWRPAPRAAAPTAPSADVLPKPQKTTIYLADRPGSTQSMVRASQFVGPRDAPEAAALELANEAWGGAFTARVNMNLREDKGWTYGARSGLSYSQLPGTFSVGASVVRDHTADAIAEVLKEIQAVKGERPLSAEELNNARGGMLGGWPLNFEQPGHLLGELSTVWRYGLAEGWVSGWPDRIRAVSPEAAQQALSQRLSADDLTIVVVGDAAVIRPSLAALGLPIVEVDTDGKPLAPAN